MKQVNNEQLQAIHWLQITNKILSKIKELFMGGASIWIYAVSAALVPTVAP